MHLQTMALHVWALFVFCLAPYAQAQTVEPTLFNAFTFSSSASAEIDNDLMTATLLVQDEDKDSAVLANRINVTMAWALDTLEPFTSIKAKTRDYQTYPRYDSSQSRRLIGWRATQSLQLDTEDFEAAGKAIQQLQERLQVQGIKLSVKPASQEIAASALIKRALFAFKGRAALIQESMNAKSYRIVDVDIQTGNASPALYDQAPRMEMMRSSVANEPAIEAGSSRMSVQVYGRIQLD
ncbi:MAG: SIMPL domain-containing protein [Granulosicoccus sp.]